MNYSHFSEYMSEIEDVLVTRFGVPRESAKRSITRLEVESVNAETEVRKLQQLVLDYKERGPVELSRITGLSRETLRRRYNAANANKYTQEVGT